MSLKGFHILFIILAVVTSAYFGYWCLGPGAAAAVSYRWLGILSLAAGGALVVYLFAFIAKMRRIGKAA